MKNKFFSLVTENKKADLNIFGDICSWAWEDLGETSSYTLSKQLAELEDVDEIVVHLNSCGGEVAEGLAIYNSLKNHPAKVTTVCEGFACSIASVIFMAGDERIMNESSLLMIHNAWKRAVGNAEELRKAAEDLDKVTQASVNAYKSHSNLAEEDIKELMDNETWILPEEAFEYGFATKVLSGTEEENMNQSAMKTISGILKEHQKSKEKPLPKPKEQHEENDCSAEQFFNAILNM